MKYKTLPDFLDYVQARDPRRARARAGSALCRCRRCWCLARARCGAERARRDRGMPRVVIRRRRDAQGGAGARDRSREDRRVLHRETFTDVAGAQAERIRGTGFGQNHPDIRGVAGHGVVAELVELVFGLVRAQ